MLHSAALLAALAGLASAKVQPGHPLNYTGLPSGGLSPEWQSYYEVKRTLPNVTFDTSRSWAGNLAVDRPDHPNNTLFFWAYEKENGSLTADAGQKQDEPWGIWLNGGPGSSSMLGLLYENGPLHLRPNLDMRKNNASWSDLADYFWVDQPVGTGYSTCDSDAFAVDENQVGTDFVGFLTNLVKVFPSLSTRPLYLTGESYAGTFIPYIANALLSMDNPPVKLAKIAIGDGAIGEKPEYKHLGVVSVIETYPQLIAYDQDVYNYFKEQTQLCGYNLNLTYPQNGHFPTLRVPQHIGEGEDDTGDNDMQRRRKRALIEDYFLSDTSPETAKMKRDWLSDPAFATSKWNVNVNQRKRDLSGRANGTIDPYYDCNLLDELIDYALNFSAPWKNHTREEGFDVNNIPSALFPRPVLNGRPFLNNNTTRDALHAPNKTWESARNYTWDSSAIPSRDRSVKPMAFLSDLATKAAAHNVGVVLYSGNDGAVTPHLATEVIIQNTTFGGVQGFTRKPATPWFDDDGELAGIVHQERNWTYVLVAGAGHRVPQQQPGRAFVLLREFILGTNQNGTIDTKTNSVVGGEREDLSVIFPGQKEIYQGAVHTQSTFAFPEATISAWDAAHTAPSNFGA